MKLKQNNIGFAIGVSFLVILTACTKDTMFDCFKSTGPIVTEDREASQFGGIVLLNNLDLYLSQGSAYSISVEAGKNLQSNIKTDINDGVLTISNQNTCNWVRSYNKPMKVYVTVVELDSIVYQSSGNIYSENTLSTDSLKIEVKEGGGQINLSIDAWKTWFMLNEGTVDLNVLGYSNVCYISSNAYGPVNCLGLYTVFTYLSSNSTNNCYVQVESDLSATIDNVGNVYYSGNPPNITYVQNGSGELIKLD